MSAFPLEFITSTADFILEQIAEAGAVSAKKMLGEYAVYCDGKVVGFVCDDQLFIKPTPAGAEFIGDFIEGFPYPGAKPHFLISGEKWDNHEWLTHLVRVSAEQLPPPKMKSRSAKA